MKRKELTKTFMMISNVKQLSPLFIRFQIVFFAVIYDLLIIHSSYFNSGFVAGNKMIDLLCSHISIYCSSSSQLYVILSQHPVFYYWQRLVT